MKNTFIALFVIIALGLVWFAFFGVKEANDTPADGALNEEVMTEENISVEDKEEVAQTLEGDRRVTLKTNQGDITILLYGKKMPITAGNFFKLAQSGFYDGTKFHRVINNFMVQGGDPNSKGDDTSLYGSGGPGYAIEDEHIAGFSNVRGTISMANSGPNSGGSQFFINLVDNTNLDFDKEPLASKHPVFGIVVGGMDIVDSIGTAPTGAGDVPLDSIIIESIEIN